MNNFTQPEIDKFITLLSDLGHQSVMEHVSWTFSISGISRVLSHQLVRNRIASYSQRSQRYVRDNQFEYVIPKEIEKDEALTKIFVEQMSSSQKAYDEIVEGLIANGRTEKQAIEDARYVFPNACETSMVVTMNARALLGFFEKRCCNRAQEEIRDLAHDMLSLVKETSPNIFKYAGRPCIALRYCPENNMQCDEYKGHIPTHKMLKTIISKNRCEA